MKTRPFDNSTFYPALEGLRGLALIAVLLFHDGLSWFRGGFLGVSTFFTLSGFLITRLLVLELQSQGRLDLAEFWERRLRRLMPAALFALALIALYGAVAGDPVQLSRLFGDGVSALLYSANWWFIATDAGYAGLIGHPSPVQHFWSLSIEEQYYIVYPLLLFGAFRLAKGSTKTIFCVLTVIALSSAYWMIWLAGTDVATERLYYGTDTRAAELIAGGMLAILWLARTEPIDSNARRIVSTTGVIGLGVTVWSWTTFTTDGTALYTGGLALYILGSAALVTTCISNSGPVASLLSARVLRWVGRISYGAYLYHWPIYLWMTPERTALEGPLLLAVRIAVSLALADASYRWIERPVRRGINFRGPHRWLAPVGGIAVIALTLGFATRNVRSEYDVTDMTAGLASREDAVRIIVVGDSVANNIAHGLQHWADESGLARVTNMATPGCGIVRGGRAETTRAEHLCDQWEQTYSLLAESQWPDIVVVYSAGYDLGPRQQKGWNGPQMIGGGAYDEWLRSEYDTLISAFSKLGAHVAWVSPLCVGDQPQRLVGESYPEKALYLDREILVPLAQSHPDDVTRLDLVSAVCPDGQFTRSLHGIEDFRNDGNHFSKEGRRWVGRWLGPRLLSMANDQRTDRQSTRSSRRTHEGG